MGWEELTQIEPGTFSIRISIHIQILNNNGLWKFTTIAFSFKFSRNFPIIVEIIAEKVHPEKPNDKLRTDEKTLLCNHHVMHNKRFHFLYLDFTFHKISFDK